MRNRFSSLAPVLLAFAMGSTAHAADIVKISVSKKQPVMMTADEMGYDSKAAIATAIGHVVVVQGDTILLADRIVYNQNTDMVHAIGHVSVLEPTGDVFFSDDAELKNNMEQGVVKEFRMRMKDNSLFASREAHKVNKNVTKLKNVVYSPCAVCAPEPGKSPGSPLWQIEASKATVDEGTQRVTYQNAFMDVYGVPAIYTPYFSHPTPDAPSQSGLLQPQYMHATDLGNVIKEPVYISLAPNMDMTLTPWYMTGEKPLLQGEFRNLTSDGEYEIRGAITDTYNRDSAGDVVPGDEVRGYIEAHGKLQLNPYWDVGLDADRTTDDTFLDLYGLGYQDLLTSRLYAERIQGRDYFDIESLAFQGLTPEDVSNQSPYILPQANLHLETDPGFAHSRFTLDGNVLALERQQGDSDQRLSATGGWKIPYITSGGQVFEADATLRGDAYSVDDQLTDATTGATFSGETGRVIPQVDFDWRYPLIKRFGPGESLMVTPVAEVTASPNLHASTTIPNEDSQIAELSDNNLFSPNRFPGLDEVESGLRAVYGVRGQLQFAEKKYIEWLLGQDYQENDNSPFPIATAAHTNFSDYIGRLAFKYKWLDMAYSFRVDRDTLEPTSNEVNTRFTLQPVSFDITYISLENEPLFGDRKEVFGGATLNITPNWDLTLNGRRDLGSSEESPVNTSLPVSALNPLEPTQGTVGLGSGVIFHNECMSVTTSLSRSYISVEDVKPSTTVAIVLLLKNFGLPTTQAPAVETTESKSGGGNGNRQSIVASDEDAPAASVTASVSDAASDTSGADKDFDYANTSTLYNTTAANGTASNTINGSKN